MKNLIILSRQHEFWTKIKIVLRYFMFNGDLPEKIKKHFEAIRVLSVYRRDDLIFFRAYFIYILPYISKSLNVAQKHQILIGHYSFLRNKLSPLQLHELFNAGIKCYQDINGNNKYQILLQAVTDHLEFEGSMYLLFKLNDVKLFTLSFTFVPGNIFGYGDERVIFISSIQGTKDQFENIRKATKFFKDNALPLILVKTLEVIALNMGIDKCLGISAKDQLSFKGGLSYERFYTNYDAFWMNIGGKLEEGHYVIPLPLQQKPILQISQSHRNRTLKKRKKLDEIVETVERSTSENLRRTA